jgi:hypothetical protein
MSDHPRGRAQFTVSIAYLPALRIFLPEVIGSASAESSTREPPDADDMDMRSDQSFDITREGALDDPSPNPLLLKYLLIGPYITNHRREDLQSGHIFHQFPKLPRE